MLDGGNDVHPRYDLAENNVFPIEPRGRRRTKEELVAIFVITTIRYSKRDRIEEVRKIRNIPSVPHGLRKRVNNKSPEIRWYLYPHLPC